MIPSLVAEELRDALVEYLATTFALAEDDAREALAGFLTDPDGGIFRGPYLRVRTPYRQVPEGWRSPLGWLPEGFRPYLHQARAFGRLAPGGGGPGPTLVSTGTGSGKTEGFLYPVLDHCRQERAAGRHGVKALLVYPMNALINDQARRIAELLAAEPALAGVTAGVYVGSDAGAAHLTSDRHALRADPPDVLLTNYRMLDLLLLRAEDRVLWTAGEPGTLRFVVLDELHTYDGAQGTDVAMLLRRLGVAAGLAAPGRPLGEAVPVATSATLGAGAEALTAMREFATRLFGTPFDEDSVVTETRQSVEEACGPVDYELPIPEVGEVVRLPATDLDELAVLFTGRRGLDPVALGERLLAHHLTRVVLAAADQFRHGDTALDAAVARAPSWGAAAQRDRDAARAALARYLALLSAARRPGGEPLLHVEVQLWVRELRRLLRRVAATPSFRWFDSAAGEPGSGDEPALELPACYCRHCGRGGWWATAAELDGSLEFHPARSYETSERARERMRAVLRASARDEGARHLDPATGKLHAAAADGTFPVLVTPDEAAAERQVCPSCGEPDSIRFLGARVPSLASVCITQLFGSELLDGPERKLLAFTDSVQDASHRAAFFAARTYRFNHRTALAGVAGGGATTLDAAAEELLAAAERPADLHALTPADLLDDPDVASLWRGEPRPEGRELLGARLAFEAALEVGLRTRVGRTLERTGTLAATTADDPAGLGDLVADLCEQVAGQGSLGADPGACAAWLTGLLDRARWRGAILHPWLEPYVHHDGRHWLVWGGRPHGMPAFPNGQSRPRFLTSRHGTGDFDSLSSTAGGTWLADWSRRALGLAPGPARELSLQVARLLASRGVLAHRRSAGGADVYGLPMRGVLLDGDAAMLRCDVCAGRLAVPAARLDQRAGSPCLRFACPGRYREAPAERARYYRRLYGSGRLRRVVAAEHTGLLERHEREEVERSFLAGDEPGAVNVLACTPTLEMGIDVGDLSAVLLTSLPRQVSSYLQRVGRAGRRGGNAFVAAVLPVEPHALQLLAEPLEMLDGQVRPPACYLDAIEILRRQYLAYLIDRAAAGAIAAPAMPRQVGAVAAAGLDPGTWLGAVAAASSAERAGELLALFGGDLSEQTAVALRDSAASGIAATVTAALDGWRARHEELGRRRDRLRDAIKRAEEHPDPDDPQGRELRRLRGERFAVVQLMRELRAEPTLLALERLGLLPNYTLHDDAVTLEAALWDSRRDSDEITVDRFSLARPARLAITELAPGNTFYAYGSKLVVGAVEVGSAAEPLQQAWRLCPECGFGAPERSRHDWSSCPRCGLAAIADTGARHQLLELRHVFSTDKRDRAQVGDDGDERDRAFYHTVTSVDVDPADVVAAWRHRHVTFGVELARAVTVRQVNLGRAGHAGEKARVAGEERVAARFRACRWCGTVARGERAEHRGWCAVRSGARAEQWDMPVLAHELRTEAARLLLPVSMFEVEERLASFTGALLLGLRLDFGGEPEHLEVARASYPAAGGPGRRRFLVLHDTVPGGTGYLGRVADPARLRALLERAREAISRCPCRDSGRVACHRCLLSRVPPREVPLVSRTLALELLDQLLDDWVLDPVRTVAEVDIGGVEESELERRFRAALATWAAKPSSGATLTPQPSPPGRQVLELRLPGARYRIEEQPPPLGSPQTRPDYLISRQDAPAPAIAVFLDGFRFHATAVSNRLADDAAKRRGLRAGGTLVWNLTWQDVDDFDKAARAPVPSQPPDRPLLTPAGAKVAAKVQHGTGGRLAAGLVQANGMRQLLAFLAEPGVRDWERLALSALAGHAHAATGAGPLGGTGDVAGAVGAALRGEPVAPGGDHPVLVAQARTAGGMPLVALLDRGGDGGAGAERWTALAVLDDRPAALAAAGHAGRWHDWLRWANLLQFLDPGVGREAMVATVSEAATLDPADLAVVPAGRQPVAPVRQDLDPAAAEELELVLDPDARQLTERALRGGAPAPVAGYELEDGAWVVEVAWPDRRVGIIIGEDAARDGWLAGAGWDARAPRQWEVDSLIVALAKDR